MSRDLTGEQEILRLAIQYREMCMPFPTKSKLEEHTRLSKLRIRALLETMQRDGLLKEKPHQPRNRKIFEVTEKGEQVAGLEVS